MEIRKSNRPYLAVRAIITDESGRVLILKRDATSYGDDEWCLPGGKIDFGQTAADAVAREVLEETSLVCKEIKFMFYQDSLPDENLELHFVNLVFSCSVTGNVKLNSESSDHAWFGPDDFSNHKIAFNNDKIIRQFFTLPEQFHASV